MPPNSSRCQGDFFVQASTNPTVHGYGNLKIAKDINLVAASDTVAVKTLTQPLALTSAKNLDLNTIDGNIVVNAIKGDTTGSVSLYAQQLGSFNARGGSLGVNLSTTDLGNMTMTAAGNYSSTSTGTSIIQGAGVTLSASGANKNLALSSTLAAVNVTAGSSVNISGTTSASLQAPAVSVGTGSTNASVNIGRNETTSVSILGQALTLGQASSVTTIPGSLIVQGQTTSVESTVVTYKDSLLELNALPSALARDSGLVMTRHGADVAVGTADASATLSAGVAIGATVLPFTVAAGGEGWYVKLTEGANTETVRISSVDGLNYSTPALTKAYTTAAVVSLYRKAAAAFVYHESSDQFRLMYTEHKAVSGNIADPAAGHYADLHIKKLIVEEGVSTASSATATYELFDNAAMPVPISGLKNRGSYQITVEAPAEGGATATFFVSKSSSAHTNGSVFCMSSAAALSGEEVSVFWPAGSPTQIFHSELRLAGTGSLVPYKVFFTTVGV